MRLKKDQIQKISEKIFKTLKEKNLIQLKVGAETVLARIQQAITDDLDAEDHLDVEIKKIMDQFRSQINSGQVNEQELFQKIKRQLIKDRKLVI